MQMNIHFLVNVAVNNRLDLNLVDLCLGKTLQISFRVFIEHVVKMSGIKEATK